MIALEAEILNLLRRLTKWNRQIFTADGHFEVPAGIRQLYITAIGGGGGGAGSMGGPVVGHPTWNSSAGAGGGAGGYLIGFPFKVPEGFSILSVKIGSGGTGQTGRTETGGNGGDTIFANAVVAPGGLGAFFHEITQGGNAYHYSSGGGTGGGIKLYNTAAGGSATSTGAAGGVPGYTSDIDGKVGTYQSYLPRYVSISSYIYAFLEGASYLGGSGGGGGGCYWDDGATLHVDLMGAGGVGGASRVLDEIYYVGGVGGASNKTTGWAGGGGGAASPFGSGGAGGSAYSPEGVDAGVAAYGAGGGGAACAPTDDEEHHGGNGKSGWLMVEWMS